MTPGYCGFFEEPDWVEDSEPQEYCTAVPNGPDRMCFVDYGGVPGRSWIESDQIISLGDYR